MLWPFLTLFVFLHRVECAQEVIQAHGGSDKPRSAEQHVLLIVVISVTILTCGVAIKQLRHRMSLKTALKGRGLRTEKKALKKDQPEVQQAPPRCPEITVIVHQDPTEASAPEAAADAAAAEPVTSENEATTGNAEPDTEPAPAPPVDTQEFTNHSEEVVSQPTDISPVALPMSPAGSAASQSARSHSRSPRSPGRLDSNESSKSNPVARKGSKSNRASTRTPQRERASTRDHREHRERSQSNRDQREHRERSYSTRDHREHRERGDDARKPRPSTRHVKKRSGEAAESGDAEAAVTKKKSGKFLMVPGSGDADESDNPTEHSIGIASDVSTAASDSLNVV